MSLQELTKFRSVVLLSFLAGACAPDAAPGGGGGPMGEPRGSEPGPEAAPEQGRGQASLVTDEPAQDAPMGNDPRVVANVEGMVTEVEDGPAVPPAGWRVIHKGEGASRVLTIRTEAGHTWKLGYHVEIGKPARSLGPDLKVLIGERVRLLFRTINHPFASAAGLVLFDGRGVRFAMDLAVFGEALQPDDVPRLTVQNGRVAQTTRGGCYEQLMHLSLIFRGDQPVDVPPDSLGTVTIDGATHAAANLFSQTAEGQLRCTDTPRQSRAWALWRDP